MEEHAALAAATDALTPGKRWGARVVLMSGVNARLVYLLQFDASCLEHFLSRFSQEPMFRLHRLESHSYVLESCEIDHTQSDFNAGSCTTAV